jgi:hypothetical protein
LKLKYFLPLLFLFAILSAQESAFGQNLRYRKINPAPPQIHFLSVDYGEGDQFPSSAPKTDRTIAIAPFEDTRRNRQYIGQQTTHGRVSAYFRSEPFPLEMSIQNFFIAALRKSGIDPIFTSAWNGNPEGMKGLKSDSIMKVVINRFWIKADTVGPKTRVYTWVYLDLLLGVKKQGKVLPQSVYVGEETLYGPEFSPQVLTNSINRTLRNVVETYWGAL